MARVNTAEYLSSISRDYPAIAPVEISDIQTDPLTSRQLIAPSIPHGNPQLTESNHRLSLIGTPEDRDDPVNTHHLPTLEQFVPKDATTAAARIAAQSAALRQPQSLEKTYRPANHERTKTREVKRPRILRRALGTVALAGLLVVGLGVRDDKEGRSIYAASAKAKTEQQSASTTTTTTKVPASPEVTTTTVAPAELTVPFKGVKIGEEAFRVDSPTNCGLSTHVLKITLDQYFDSSKETSGSEIRTPQDIMRPVNPLERQEKCDQVTEYLNKVKQETGIDIPFRGDRHTSGRTQNPLLLDGKPVSAGELEAIATWVENSSAAPGQKGHIVVSAHGSGHSTAHGNLGALKEGDLQYIVDEANNKVFEYSYLGFDSIEPNAEGLDKLQYYTPGILNREVDPTTGYTTNVSYDNGYLTQVTCTDKNHVPGRSTIRTAYRSKFTGKVFTVQEYVKKILSGLSDAVNPYK